MNRFKLLLLLLILAILSVLFLQNQMLLSLKFLCAEVGQACVYQTPKLPLAVWMGIFILAGMLTSLIWQLLNSLGYSRINKRNYSESESSQTFITEPTPPVSSVPSTSKFDTDESTESDWENRSREEDWNTEEPVTQSFKDSVDTQSEAEKSYEVQQKPTSVQRSGSTYSYKYREAKDTQPQSDKQVYDADYKVINPPHKPIDEEETAANEDEEWI